MYAVCFQIAVQDTFNEQEGNPSVYNEPPPEPRAPPMNLEPSDQRYAFIATNLGLKSLCC